ncbi:MAG: hypothetical protein KAR44_05310 [Candidatus Aegiribacteria sp.]|nr:hypothetical protein [Candidatus Aegiribacteria sp.]
MIHVFLAFFALTASPLTTLTVQTQLSSIPAIEELPGGEFAAMVIDLQTGDVLTSTGSGSFPLDDPDIFMLAYVVELMQENIVSPDTIVGRDETVADRFRRALHGNREAAGRAMWAVGLESLSAWVGANGMTDTELHDIQLLWAGAPETDPSISTPGDIARALQIIHSGMNMSAVREILENPDMGEGQASSIAEGWDLYGWVDSGESHKTFVLIAISPEGSELGLILLSDDLCCVEKGDLAMMLLWEAALQL